MEKTTAPSCILIAVLLLSPKKVDWTSAQSGSCTFRQVALIAPYPFYIDI